MRKKASNNAETKDTKRYEPTPQERIVMEAYFARREEKRPAPRMNISEKDGAANIAPDHPEPKIANVLLMEALGTSDPDFLAGLLTQLTNAGTQDQEVDEDGLNFMLSVVKGVEPKDQVEAMLAAQMAAVHIATMTFARRLAHVDNIPQQDSAERAFNKLARTFASQVEASEPPSRPASKRVTVEHVHRPSKAVRPSSERLRPRRGAHEIRGTAPCKQIAHAPGMRCGARTRSDEPVPITSNAERSVPTARRKITGCSEG